MKRLPRLIIIIALVTIFSGCSNILRNATQPEVGPSSETDPCFQAIKEGTDRIHQELVKLAKYRQQKDYQKIARVKTYETPTKGPLSKLVDMTWSGPIDKMLAKLAEKAGYQFPLALGTPHFRDTFVQVDVVNTPIFKIIEDVGWQAGDRIAVILDTDRKILSLAYQGD